MMTLTTTDWVLVMLQAPVTSSTYIHHLISSLNSSACGPHIADAEMEAQRDEASERQSKVQTQLFLLPPSPKSLTTVFCGLPSDERHTNRRQEN